MSLEDRFCTTAKEAAFDAISLIGRAFLADERGEAVDAIRYLKTAHACTTFLMGEITEQMLRLAEPTPEDVPEDPPVKLVEHCPDLIEPAAEF